MFKAKRMQIYAGKRELYVVYMLEQTFLALGALRQQLARRFMALN